MENYELGERIGQGGMGVVFRGRHLALDMDVAVKFIHPHLSEDDEAVKRFLQEARTVARINHENVVRVSDMGRDGQGRPFIVMEMLQGESLANRLARGRMSESEAVEVVSQLLQALSAAHAVGVVHRDLKPGNVWLAPGGRVKLLDFGIAKALSSSIVSGTGASIGTPAYMSPEQADGKPADHRADLYSLGIVFYEMLAGDVPFRAESPLAVLRMHTDKVAPTLPSTYSAAVRRVVAKSLEKDRQKRYQSADQMRSDLLGIPLDATSARGLGAVYPSGASSPTPLPSRQTRRMVFRPRVHAPFVAAAVLAGGGYGYFQFNGARTPSLESWKPAAKADAPATTPTEAVTKKTVVVIEPVLFEKRTQNDRTLAKGATKTVQAGRVGEKVVTYELRADGTRGAVLKTDVTKKPQDQVVAVGTREAAPERIKRENRQANRSDERPRARPVERPRQRERQRYRFCSQCAMRLPAGTFCPEHGE